MMRNAAESRKNQSPGSRLEPWMSAADVSMFPIDGARRADLSAIRRLLDAEHLSSEDVDESALEHFLVCRDEIGVAGVVGLEKYGDVALLRSLVVTEKYLGRGLGKRLVAAADVLAAETGVRRMYLLTTTAEAFFDYLGFRRISREAAPQAIQSTREFSCLCPATAAVMVKP
jgi:amino-acid N-acetyltransferase